MKIFAWYSVPQKKCYVHVYTFGYSIHTTVRLFKLIRIQRKNDVQVNQFETQNLGVKSEI